MPQVLPFISTGLGVYGALKGNGKPTTTPTTPPDLQPMRAQQIALLQYLMGMGPDPRSTGIGTPQAATDYSSGKIDAFKQGGDSGLSKYVQARPGGPTGTPQNQPTNYQAPTYANAAPWIPRMAEGGVVPPGIVEGPGGPTSDSVPAMLSDGEGVLTAEAVKNLGGPATIEEINKLFGGPQGADAGAMIQQFLGSLGGQPEQGMPPQMQGGMPHMADGGVAGTPLINPMPQQPVSMLPTQPDAGLPGVLPGSNAPTGVQSPQQRLESFYGPLGMYASPLQQQSSGAMSQYLNQPSPEARTLGVAQPALEQNINGGSASAQSAINGLMGLTTGPSGNVSQGLGNVGNRPQTGFAGGDAALQQLATGAQSSQLGGAGQVAPQGAFGGSSAAQGILQALAGQNSGQAVTQALQPVYEHNLALANLQGGRFGTANALQRGQALNDFNVNAANAMQRGVDQQIQAGTALGQTDLGFNTNQLGARGQDTQAAIASANNRLTGNTTGLNAQLSALGLAQTGQQGLDDATIRALSSLGGLQAQGQGQTGTNISNAGQLGIGNAGVQNTAANVLGQLGASAGGAERGGINQGFNMGATETAQGYTGQQNTINLLNQLLGTAQGASIGGGTIQNQGGGTAATQIAQLLSLLGRSGNGSNTGTQVPMNSGA